jgi:hypothetical protein
LHGWALVGEPEGGASGDLLTRVEHFELFEDLREQQIEGERGGGFVRGEEPLGGRSLHSRIARALEVKGVREVARRS